MLREHQIKECEERAAARARARDKQTPQYASARTARKLRQQKAEEERRRWEARCARLGRKPVV